MTYPDPINVTTFPAMIRYGNNVGEGILGIGILISIYFVILIYFVSRSQSVQASSTAAGFVTAMLGIFLFFMDTISEVQLFACVVSFVFPLLWSYFSAE